MDDFFVICQLFYERCNCVPYFLGTRHPISTFSSRQLRPRVTKGGQVATILKRLFKRSTTTIVRHPVMVRVKGLLLHNVTFRRHVRSSSLVNELRFKPPQRTITKRRQAGRRLSPIMTNRVTRQSSITRSIFRFCKTIIPHSIISTHRGSRSLQFRISRITTRANRRLSNHLPTSATIRRPIPFRRVKVSTGPTVNSKVTRRSRLSKPIRRNVLGFVASMLHPIRQSVNAGHHSKRGDRQRRCSFFRTNRANFKFSLAGLRGTKRSTIHVRRRVMRVHTGRS